jgi:Mg2+ and Co2+ transporter CorA
MDVWIDNQNWTEEIWFAIAAAAVLAVLLYSIFRTHFWS